MSDATDREVPRHPVTPPNAPARSTASPPPTDEPPPTPSLPGSGARTERPRWRIPTDPPPV
jgi:hypothetical protein